MQARTVSFIALTSFALLPICAAAQTPPQVDTLETPNPEQLLYIFN
ncbi:hypothetical protein KG088_14295 [Halomonas sp. TRM85114]|nr:hypothetical protein [Halomonas jincaotanensis]MBS9404806.1 hypothetical protein [Halomonas jincaotanensis]